jgi:hypothetical protein
MYARALYFNRYRWFPSLLKCAMASRSPQMWHVCTCFVLQSLSMVSLSPQMRDGFPLSSNVPSNRLMLLQELLFALAIQWHEIQMGTES